MVADLHQHPVNHVVLGWESRAAVKVMEYDSQTLLVGPALQLAHGRIEIGRPQRPTNGTIQLPPGPHIAKVYDDQLVPHRAQGRSEGSEPAGPRRPKDKKAAITPPDRPLYVADHGVLRQEVCFRNAAAAMIQGVHTPRWQPVLVA